MGKPDARSLFVRALRVDSARASQPDYALSLPAMRCLAANGLSLRAPVTFFVGENGTGKSTLLEAVAVALGFNAEGGTRNFRFATAATHSALHEAMVVVRGTRRPSAGFFLRAESFYNVATEVDRLDAICPLLPAYGGKSLHAQSHGESFWSLVMHRFHGDALYLLDEPEAALSPTRQLALLARLHALAGEGAQFLIATHSPLLMACPGADIWTLSDEGMQRTPYEQTEHYVLTRAFLNQPERMLATLLEPGADEAPSKAP